MIESIVGVGAVTAFTPSVGSSTERRRKRLNWLSSLRAAGGLSVDDIDEDGPKAAIARAEIADALGAAEEMVAQLGHEQNESGETVSGPTITAAQIAKRIAASATRSLAVQAHVGAAAARRYVDGRDENAQ